VATRRARQNHHIAGIGDLDHPAPLMVRYGRSGPTVAVSVADLDHVVEGYQQRFFAMSMPTLVEVKSEYWAALVGLGVIQWSVLIWHCWSSVSPVALITKPTYPAPIDLRYDLFGRSALIDRCFVIPLADARAGLDAMAESNGCPESLTWVDLCTAGGDD
jgi:hypothetical protein